MTVLHDKPYIMPYNVQNDTQPPRNNMNNQLIWQHQLPETVLQIVSKEAASLMQAQSLTAALRSIDAVFSVRLLHLGGNSFDYVFSDGLPSEKNNTWFCRDVLLCLNDTPVVWARSMCRSDAANWLSLLDCGTRPLGEKLFDGSLPLTRSRFEYTVPKSEKSNCEPDNFNGSAFVVRRSFFTWQQTQLGLAEYFLPALQSFV